MAEAEKKKLSSVRFILVRPRNPNNIGAVARAMANFGLSDLVLADPYGPTWEECRAAVGGEEVLRRARSSALPGALEDSQLVLGTHDGRRSLRRPVVPLTQLAGYLKENLPAKGRLAILFGSEKTGLRNKELQHCHAVLRIPTEPGNPSMNLGQAAAVIAYALHAISKKDIALRPDDPLASSAQREDLVNKMIAAMDRLDCMRDIPVPAKTERIREMLVRWRILSEDAALLQDILKRVVRR